MKKLILLMVLPTAIAACNNGDLQQARLTQMCDCMEKNKELFTNPITAATMGSYSNTTLAASTALNCAQQVLKSNNIMDLETMHLFTEFQKNPCAKNYGIDPSSINKAENDAKQTLNNILPQQKELVTDQPHAQSPTETYIDQPPLVIRKTNFYANGENSSDANLANAAITYLVLHVNKTSSYWDGKNVDFSIKLYDSAGNAVYGKVATDGNFSDGNINIEDSILPVDSSNSTEMSNLFRLDYAKQGTLEPGQYRMEIWCESQRIYTTYFNITW